MYGVTTWRCPAGHQAWGGALSAGTLVTCGWLLPTTVNQVFDRCGRQMSRTQAVVYYVEASNCTDIDWMRDTGECG